jgi:hypothetical protein
VDTSNSQRPGPGRGWDALHPIPPPGRLAGSRRRFLGALDYVPFGISPIAAPPRLLETEDHHREMVIHMPETVRCL